MDIYTNDKIFTILNKDFKKFKSGLYDDDYELFKDMNEDKLHNLFLYSIVNNSKIMKKVKTKLLKNNILEKDINKLFYTTLKFYYKYDKGLFSWAEIEEWDIELDDIKTTSTKYTLI